ARPCCPQQLHLQHPEADAGRRRARRDEAQLEQRATLGEAQVGEVLGHAGQRGQRVAALAARGKRQAEREQDERTGGDRARSSFAPATPQRMNPLRSWSWTKGASLALTPAA